MFFNEVLALCSALTTVPSLQPLSTNLHWSSPVPSAQRWLAISFIWHPVCHFKLNLLYWWPTRWRDSDDSCLSVHTCVLFCFSERFLTGNFIWSVCTCSSCSHFDDLEMRNQPCLPSAVNSRSVVASCVCSHCSVRLPTRIESFFLYNFSMNRN